LRRLKLADAVFQYIFAQSRIVHIFFVGTHFVSPLECVTWSGRATVRAADLILIELLYLCLRLLRFYASGRKFTPVPFDSLADRGGFRVFFSFRFNALFQCVTFHRRHQ
jgi:hypothetical protein